jgi:phasin
MAVQRAAVKVSSGHGSSQARVRIKPGQGPRQVESRPVEDLYAMSEAIEAPVPVSRSKYKPSGTPKLEVPSFDLPKMEIPAAFRELAERSVSQAKESYEKMKSATEQATDVLEDTYATATKGVSEYGLKLIEVARENANSAFDFATQLMSVKSFSEAVELSTAHSRKQYEAVTAQAKELAAMAQKVAAETTEPVREGLGKVFKVS